MWKYLIGVLLLLNISLWFVVLTFPDEYLHIVACDVGQGDGILIFKGTTQIIIDGGPGNKMVGCIDRHIPFWDRSIELVMLTHPQADHYEGLIDIFKRYSVQIFVGSGLDSINESYQVLKNEVRSEGSKVVVPRKGMQLIQDQIVFTVLTPSADFLADNSTDVKTSTNAVLGVYSTLLDPNQFSIIQTLQYNEFDALFTGDTDSEIQDSLIQSIDLPDIEYLKVPHHGSKNGLTKEFLEAVTPELAIISNGKKNMYGHPHKEILSMLEEAKVQILRTDQMGDVEIVSDGVRYWVKK